MNSYMEMIYIDDQGDARQTNVRAAFATNAETWTQFQLCRPFEVTQNKARFLLDYYNSKGDLSHTILLDAIGFETITDEKPKSDAEYREIDAAYWAAAREEYEKTKKKAA